jgi:hypothetical protein
MSDWSTEEKDGVKTLHIHPCDSESTIEVEQHFNGELYYFNFRGYRYPDHMAKIDEADVSVDIAGRNLEVMRGFLLEPILSSVIAENHRLHNLLQHIKYNASGLSNKFDGVQDTPLAQWICEQITDKDAGW